MKSRMPERAKLLFRWPERITRKGLWLAAFCAVVAWSTPALAVIIQKEGFDTDPGFCSQNGKEHCSKFSVDKGIAALRYAQQVATDSNQDVDSGVCYSPPGGCQNSPWAVTIQPGVVVEVRADVLSINEPRAYAVLGLGAEEGGYRVMTDFKDLTIAKYGKVDGESWDAHLFWRPIYLPSGGPRTLSAAFRHTETGTEILVKILDPSNQEVLYQVRVKDTGRDDSLQGLQRGINLQPEAIVAPFSRTPMLPWLGVAYLNVQKPPSKTILVTMDNLEVSEFVEPELTMEQAVTLTWEKDTMGQYVLLVSDSLQKPVWHLWPEPVFDRNGEMRSTAPAAATPRYFKPVPGLQYMDTFEDAKAPFGPRQAYKTTWAESGDSITVANGIMKISSRAPASDGVVLEPPNAPVQVKDFYMSVDVLGWNNTGPSSSVGLVARGNWNAGAYAGVLVWNPNGLNGVAQLRMLASTTEVTGPGFKWEPNTAYRLEYSGTGKDLVLRVSNLKTLAVVKEMKVADTQRKEGFAGLWVDTRAQSRTTPSEITLDNFFVTGTSPEGIVVPEALPPYWLE